MRPRMNRIVDHWWMFLARALTSFAFAMLLLLGPGWSSIGTLAMAFGIWAVVDGAGSLAFVLGVPSVRTATYLARGGLGIGLGALALAVPSMPATALYLLVGTWAVGTGSLEMAFGARTWSVAPRALGFMLVGAQSLAFGLSVVHVPTESVAMLRGFLVAFAVVNGISALAMGEWLHAAPSRRHLATP